MSEPFPKITLTSTQHIGPQDLADRFNAMLYSELERFAAQLATELHALDEEAFAALQRGLAKAGGTQ